MEVARLLTVVTLPEPRVDPQGLTISGVAGMLGNFQNRPATPLGHWPSARL
jgi:hypothetical protein